MKIFTNKQGRICSLNSTKDASLTEYDTDLLDGIIENDYEFFMYSYKETKDGGIEVLPLVPPELVNVVHAVAAYVGSKKKR